MRIFTSYFANIKNIPKSFFLVSASLNIDISLYNYVDLCDVVLAPNDRILKEYKQTLDINRYVYRFNEEIISKIDWLERFELYESHANKIGKTIENIVLLCYESVDSDDGKGKFCHRFILAENIEKEFSTKVLEYGYEHYYRKDYKLIRPISTDFLF